MIIGAHIDLDTWTRPAIFKWLETQGDVSTEDMLRTTAALVVMFCTPQHVEDVIEVLASTGEEPLVIGELTARQTNSVVFSGAFA